MEINKNIATFFVEQGILDTHKATEVLDRSVLNKTRFDYEVQKMGLVETLVIQRYMAQFFNIPFLDFNVLSLDTNISKNLPIAFMKDNRVLPIHLNEKVTVAIDSSNNFQEALSVRHFYNLDVEIGMISTDQMEKALINLETKRKQKEALSGISDQIKAEDYDDTEKRIVNAPAVLLADSILKEAVALQASDIHIEPFESEVIIRFRIDGALIENSRMLPHIYQSVLARYKIIASLNIAERRIPQDGKIRLDINGRPYDFRVSTIPTIHGEKIVIRIYDTSTQKLGLSYLGARKNQEKQLQKIISKPHGILLVTGPTGSGKSTTLYTFLKELNDGTVNITTVEDPVENVIAGVNQVQVNPKANLTFSTALRSILRQDPNIIMLGEIRDEETAQISIRAAITGHLVLATLHTNDAIGSFDRLVDMNVPHYLVADAMIGSIAQRLVRKLCPRCKKEHELSVGEMSILGVDKKTKIMTPVGCDSCNFTGYQGRTAVFEILEMDDEVKHKLTKEKLSAEEIRDFLKKKGMYFLEDSCRELVLEGITSIEEFSSLVTR